MTCPIGCDVIPAAIGRCERGTPSCLADHRSVQPCPLETEMAEHRFVCQLRAGHDGGHQWWLAAPVNTWLTMPSWTAKTLIEDNWSDA